MLLARVVALTTNFARFQRPKITSIGVLVPWCQIWFLGASGSLEQPPRHMSVPGKSSQENRRPRRIRPGALISQENAPRNPCLLVYYSWENSSGTTIFLGRLLLLLLFIHRLSQPPLRQLCSVRLLL